MLGDQLGEGPRILLFEPVQIHAASLVRAALRAPCLGHRISARPAACGFTRGGLPQE
jgi:hypothetical protein